MKQEKAFVVHAKCQRCKGWESVTRLDGSDIKKLITWKCPYCNKSVDWVAEPKTTISN